MLIKIFKKDTCILSLTVLIQEQRWTKKIDEDLLMQF